MIYDPRTGRQSYHEGHGGDVISLTVSSCRHFAASGDAADPPRVHVWDAVTGAGERGARKGSVILTRKKKRHRNSHNP